jgi:hypothetical protein
MGDEERALFISVHSNHFCAALELIGRPELARNPSCTTMRSHAAHAAEGEPRPFRAVSKAQLISLEAADEHGPDQRKLETIRRKGKGDLGTIDRR